MLAVVKSIGDAMVRVFDLCAAVFVTVPITVYEFVPDKPLIVNTVDGPFTAYVGA